MTWETVEKKRFPVAPFYLALAFILLASLAFFREGSIVSPQQACEERNGEWLHASVKPTCITSDGQWLLYDEKLHDFVLSDGAPAPLVAAASTEASSEENMTCSGGSFTDHPSEVVSNARLHDADFSTWPDAKRYRSAINKDVSRGINFAGHYVISSWGCPQFESCEGYAVIDALSGKILSFGQTSYGRPRYLPDSRLLETELENGSKTYLINEDTKTLEQCK
jgi:hypothetical protein